MANTDVLTRLADQLAAQNKIKILDREAFEARVLDAVAGLVNERLYLLEARKLGMVADIGEEEKPKVQAPAKEKPVDAPPKEK